MIIKTEQELENLKEIGTIVAKIRDILAKEARVGVSTKFLDNIAKDLFKENNAVSAPIAMYNFPGYTNISINEVAAHGIPSDYKIKNGDKVNIDVSGMKNGYYADTAITIIAGDGNIQYEDMQRVSMDALYNGIKAAKPGSLTSNIGKAIFKTAITNGYTVLRNLTGHGVGKSLHEEPHYIFNYNEREGASLLNEGQVIAIETFVSNGDEWVEENEHEDDWELLTLEKSIIIQYEHTIVVRESGNIILTDYENSLF